MLIKIVDMGIETRLGKRTENLEPGGHSSVFVSGGQITVLVEEADESNRLIAEITIPIDVLRVAIGNAIRTEEGELD